MLAAFARAATANVIKAQKFLPGFGAASASIAVRFKHKRAKRRARMSVAARVGFLIRARLIAGAAMRIAPAAFAGNHRAWC